jgi:hypothetical protein
MKKYLLLSILLLIGALVISGCTPAAQDTNSTDYTQIDVSANTTTSVAEEPVMEEEVVPMPTTSGAELEGVVIQKTEGDLIQLRPEAIDPDDDAVTYYFTSPFDSKGKWQTREGDAGTYPVTVTASDGKANTSQDITIVVLRAKRAPVVECPESMTVREGDTISLTCNIYDPEGDQAVVEYSGFMKSGTYTTSYDDAGEYTTIVTASNNYKKAEATVKITVLNTNRDPVISFASDQVSGTENDILTIRPEVSDPDGDKVTVTYSDPFDSTGSWKTKIGDAGVYTASVVASDGTTTTRRDVTVRLAMRNTAPTLKRISDITVFEGETIRLPIDVVDREGDKINVAVRGWMNSQTYTTNYDDAGEYSVTVTASDGQYDASQTFKVTVVDRNRPPVFKVPA